MHIKEPCFCEPYYDKVCRFCREQTERYEMKRRWIHKYPNGETEKVLEEIARCENRAR